MNAVRAIKSLGPIDSRNVMRDSLLKWMLVIPPGIALGLRWVAPIALARLAALFPIDLTPYYSPIVGYLLMSLTPLLVGMVIGFLLLDERDDQTIQALQVTPLSLNGYLIYRLTVPSLLSAVLTVILFPLAGLMELSWPGLVAVAICSAPLAPLFALFFAAFAQNKVQGFALQKASGIILMPPLLAYFIQSPLQLVFGIVPTFWPAKLYWTLKAGGPDAWVYLVVGLAYQGLLVVALVRRFNKVMSQM